MLVDKQISRMCSQDGLLENYEESNITNIGYDLTAEAFYYSTKEKVGDKATLLPGESLFIGSKEILNLPVFYSAHVCLKNSRIREGLLLTAPVYQPGHRTKIYFRITNVSANEITMNAGDKLAMIVFERLDDKPDHPYEGTFRDEFDYKGMGEYEAAYNKQIKKLNDTKDELHQLERSIYSNVLVILTIFIAIFSFMTTNINAYANTASLKNILVLNCSFLAGLSFLIGLLDLYINKEKWSKFWKFGVITIVLVALTFLIYCKL